MNRRAALYLLLCLPAVALAEIYRWVDDKGQVHYTQTPPLYRKYEAMSAAPPPATSNQDDLNKALEQDIKDRPAQQAAEAKAAQAQAQRQENCKQAMAQLARLEARTARRLATTDAQGKIARMTEAQFQERRGAEQKKIAENCP